MFQRLAWNHPGGFNPSPNATMKSWAHRWLPGVGEVMELPWVCLVLPEACCHWKVIIGGVGEDSSLLMRHQVSIIIIIIIRFGTRHPHQGDLDAAKLSYQFFMAIATPSRPLCSISLTCHPSRDCQIDAGLGSAVKQSFSSTGVKVSHGVTSRSQDPLITGK